MDHTTNLAILALLINDHLQILERELDRLEEERIQLKTDNRALARQLGQKAAELALEPEDLQVQQLGKKKSGARLRDKIRGCYRLGRVD